MYALLDWWACLMPQGYCFTAYNTAYLILITFCISKKNNVHLLFKMKFLFNRMLLKPHLRKLNVYFIEWLKDTCISNQEHILLYLNVYKSRINKKCVKKAAI